TGSYAERKEWSRAISIINRIHSEIGSKLKVNMAVKELDEKTKVKTKKMFSDLQADFGKRFIGKINIPLEEMDLFYYDLDLFILTSKPNTESFGRTLVEAMSRRTAVLTTNAGGAEEVVGSSKNVCSSFEEIVTRTMELINNSEKLEYEKERNMYRVREKYS